MRTVIAENCLCFYAIWEMVLPDVGIETFYQYNLANEFEAVLPSGYSIPSVHNICFSGNIGDKGAHIDEAKINAFFLRNEINLRLSFVKEAHCVDYECDQYDIFCREKTVYCIYAFSYGGLQHKAYNEGQAEQNDQGPVDSHDEPVRPRKPGGNRALRIRSRVRSREASECRRLYCFPFCRRLRYSIGLRPSAFRKHWEK